MKIAIDASQVVYETGVSVYTRNLIKSLLDLDKKNEYTLYGGSLRRLFKLNGIFQELTKEKNNARSLVYPIPPFMADVVFNRLGLNIDQFIGKVDIFHSSDWTQPATSALKITTVHDLVPILYAKMSHPRIVDVHKRRLERVLKYANKVIVPSDTTKSDFAKMGYPEKSIVVIPEAVDSSFHKPNREIINKTRVKYQLNSKYLLVVGTSFRKNIDRIVQAFEKVRVEHRLKLVVVGEVPKSMHFVRNVKYLGNVPQKDIVSLYSGSEALVYPSLYEGFGLPILEAFSLNIPVLTSDRGSMKDIAGIAAVLVNPEDVASISDGIEKLLENKTHYTKLGRKQIKKYNWKKTAALTLELYESLAK